MSFGHERKQHPMHKEKATKQMKKDDQNTTESADVPVVQFQSKVDSKAPSNLADLAHQQVLQHSLSVPRKLQVPEKPQATRSHASSAMQSQAWKTNQHMKWGDKDDPVLSPTVILIIAAGSLLVAVAMVVFIKSGHDGYKSLSFGDRSGLSTSSSDITSSETGSTDRELKNRMERFEKRLEEHKRMLEVGESVEGAGNGGTSASTSQATPSAANTGPVRLTWMQKK